MAFIFTDTGHSFGITADGKVVITNSTYAELTKME
jgi:hypothetical protein